MRSLAWVLARRRLRSAPRLALLLALVGLDAATALLSGGGAAPEPAIAGWSALVLTAGVLGQEWREGSLAVLLCRPLSRTGLVLAAWCAGATGGFAAWLVAAGLRLLLAALPSVELPAELPQGIGSLGLAAAAAAGLAAAALFFAIAGRGLAGAGVHLVLLFLAAGVLGASSQHGGSPLEEPARLLAELLLPFPDERAWATGDVSALHALLAWTSNVALLVTGSLWLLQRARLSYSSQE